VIRRLPRMDTCAADVLVVDDDPTVAEVAAAACLRRAGRRVRLAAGVGYRLDHSADGHACKVEGTNA
jgi:CheY-like chemotaxis protein